MPQSQYEPGAFPFGFMQARQLVPALMQYPALTLMVFFRRRIGYRVVKPGPLIGMALVLIILPHIFSAIAAIPAMFLPFARRQVPPPSLLARLFDFLAPFPLPSALTLFALLMVALGYLQRWRRWRELRRGARWHTMSRGISPFETIFFHVRRDWIYRYVDPLACFLAGWLLFQISFTGLGLWVMFSAFALRIVEQTVFDKSLERDLDTLDALIESEVQAETVDHFQGGPVKERPLSETAGIPTGAGADLEAQIATRRAKQKQQPAQASAPLQANDAQAAAAGAGTNGTAPPSASPGATSRKFCTACGERLLPEVLHACMSRVSRQ